MFCTLTISIERASAGVREMSRPSFPYRKRMTREVALEKITEQYGQTPDELEQTRERYEELLRQATDESIEARRVSLSTRDEDTLSRNEQLLLSLIPKEQRARKRLANENAHSSRQHTPSDPSRRRHRRVIPDLDRSTPLDQQSTASLCRWVRELTMSTNITPEEADQFDLLTDELRRRVRSLVTYDLPPETLAFLAPSECRHHRYAHRS